MGRLAACMLAFLLIDCNGPLLVATDDRWVQHTQVSIVDNVWSCVTSSEGCFKVYTVQFPLFNFVQLPAFKSAQFSQTLSVHS